MSEPITDAERATLAEIVADQPAFDLLAKKCFWEGMGLYAVLREWGDPRTWDSYKSAPQPGPEEGR